MIKPVLVHTLIGTDWHLYFGLCLHARTEWICDKARLRIDALLIDGDSLRIQHNIEHLDDLISAHYFVWFGEHKRMWEDVKGDVDKRHIWQNRLKEYESIMNDF